MNFGLHKITSVDNILNNLILEKANTAKALVNFKTIIKYTVKSCGERQPLYSKF
jgi:hypothetical protein